MSGKWIDITDGDKSDSCTEIDPVKKLAEQAQKKALQARKETLQRPVLPGLADFSRPAVSEKKTIPNVASKPDPTAKTKPKEKTPPSTVHPAAPQPGKKLSRTPNSMSPQRSPPPVQDQKEHEDPVKSPQDGAGSDHDDAILGMVRRVAEGQWQVRTPDGTILNQNFPTSESAHMALAALDEMRRKSKKLYPNNAQQNDQSLFTGLSRMPDGYYAGQKERGRYRNRSRSFSGGRRGARKRPRSRRSDLRSRSPPAPLRKKMKRSRSYSWDGRRRHRHSRSPRRRDRYRRDERSREHHRRRRGYRGRAHSPARRGRSHRGRHQPPIQPAKTLQTMIEREPSPKVSGPAPPDPEQQKKWDEMRQRSPSVEVPRSEEPDDLNGVNSSRKNIQTKDKQVQQNKRRLVVEKRPNTRTVVRTVREVVIPDSVEVESEVFPMALSEEEKRKLELTKEALKRTRMLEINKLKALLTQNLKKSRAKADDNLVVRQQKSDDELEHLREKALASMHNRRIVEVPTETGAP